MTDVILISGGTGFLGTALCAELLKIVRQGNFAFGKAVPGETGDGTAIYVLVRASSDAEACHRLREAWQHDEALYEASEGASIPWWGTSPNPTWDWTRRQRTCCVCM